MNTNPNDPAFPVNTNGLKFAGNMPEDGMTLRQYYAGQALSDLPPASADPNDERYSDLPKHWSEVTGVPQPELGGATRKEWHEFWLQVEAINKVQKADALISALNKTE